MLSVRDRRSWRAKRRVENGVAEPIRGDDTRNGESRRRLRDCGARGARGHAGVSETSPRNRTWHAVLVDVRALQAGTAGSRQHHFGVALSAAANTRARLL